VEHVLERDVAPNPPPLAGADQSACD
jgi:hypothetical protein